MLKKIINNFNQLEKITSKVMLSGFEFCFIICLISVLILLTYNFVFHSPTLYYIGLSLFRLCLIYNIEFIICGFIADGIKKQII